MEAIYQLAEIFDQVTQDPNRSKNFQPPRMEKIQQPPTLPMVKKIDQWTNLPRVKYITPHNKIQRKSTKTVSPTSNITSQI